MGPHIVLIMADHLRRDCLSCCGDMAVNTLNLDALARESIVFDRACCTTPLCTLRVRRWVPQGLGTVAAYATRLSDNLADQQTGRSG